MEQEKEYSVNKMSSSLEMLTKAVDFVETQDKQKRLRESPSPTTDTRKISSNHGEEPKPHDTREAVENGVSETNGTAESRQHDRVSRNAATHISHSKESTGADLARPVNNHGGKGNKDGEKPIQENSTTADQRQTVDTGLLEEQTRYYLYQQKLLEQANGIPARAEKVLRVEEQLAAAARQSSPERYQPAYSKSSSPTADRGGDTHPATKPMVVLQHHPATTLTSVGSAHTVPLSNPQLHATAMHHPYMYPLMYAGATLDPALSALGRAPGTGLKDGEGQTSPQNGSPITGLPTGAAGMHFPGAAFLHPLASQALLMGPRPPGTVSDISPLLLAQSSAYQVPVFADQYKRMLEGIPQFPAAYSLQPQLADQYLKSLAGQGLDGGKDALTLGGLASRIPHGLSLAALQGQPGASDLLLRYPDLGLARPQDGISPRSASPYANKRRTESPVISNGSKIAASYPYHPSLAGSQLNNLGGQRTHARSPAFSQGRRSRSPITEVRKSEAERSGFRSHSRDLDRDSKPSNKDLASTSTSGNHIRSTEEHLAAYSYSVTDPAGRKIHVPPFYNGPSVHVPQGYHGLSAHHPGHDRSPSPHSRPSEDRGYHRPSRDRSPVAEIQSKRRSFESQYVARNSPLLNDRHNSRPTSPANNGQVPSIRAQFPLVNGSAEAAAELVKANQHLLLSANHTRSPNPGAFTPEGRDQRSGSPSANPFLAAGYFNPQLLGGLGGAAGGSPLFLQQYAALAKTDLASLYKSGENVPEYARIPGLSSLGLPLHLLSAQPLTGGRAPPVLPQDYVAAFKSSPYFAPPVGPKESGKASPANGKEKISGLPQQIHPGLLQQQSPQSMSPAKVGMKPKHSPSPQHTKPSSHHPHVAESHSPTPGATSSVLSSSESRRYHSPSLDRPTREASPKPVSNKPYRPNSMLRQHAEDLERKRKRKLEEAIREESYMHEKHHIQPRPDQREYAMKDARTDTKRRKQLITGGEADPDVEEHFRRALGKNYKESCNKVSISGSVEDHFKKSLGDGWEKVRTATNALPAKSESRDSAPHTAHVLPSYSAAISQSVRGYPPHPDNKEVLSRMYDQAFIRERYLAPSIVTPPRKGEKSPPRLPVSSTVLYPHPHPIGPVRQKVKAKSLFIPEAPHAAPDMTNSSRSARSSSLGSKGSSRSISGSSVESIPVAVSKTPPASSPTSIADGVPRLPHQVISNAIPFTFAHHQGVPSSAVVSQHEPPSIENNSTPRHRSSPTSPRVPVSEESTRNQSSPPQSFQPAIVTSKESGERRKSEEGRSST